MQDLLMHHHIICFEDYQKATGYERQPRINYFQKDENMLQIESDSDIDSESLISVESNDPKFIMAELDAMCLNFDLKKGEIDQGEDSDTSVEAEDLVPVMSVNSMPSGNCIVEDDDEIEGIQRVAAFRYAPEQIVKSKESGDQGKTMDKMMQMFEAESLQDRGYLSLNNLQLLPPADEQTLSEANKLKEQLCPKSRLFPELINETICWVSKEGVNQLEIYHALQIQDKLGRKSVLLNTGGHGGAGNMNPSNVDLMGSSQSISQDSELAKMSTCEVAMHICQKSGDTRIAPIFPSNIDTIITWCHGKDTLEAYRTPETKPAETQEITFHITENLKPVQNQLNTAIPSHTLDCMKQAHSQLGKLDITTIHQKSPINQDSKLIFKENQNLKFQTMKSSYTGQIVETGGIFGMLQETQPHGIGRCTSEDGFNFHEGQFKEGQMHGYGRALFDWGGYYEGLWANDKWQGQGKYVNEQGDIFEGEWSNGIPHGQLTITKKSSPMSMINGKSTTISGVWNQGRIEGNGKLWHKY